MTTDVFDLAHFAERHDPVVIGTIPESDRRAMFNCDYFALRLLDLPIKVPNSYDLHLPPYALRFQSFVDQGVARLVATRGWGWYAQRYLYLAVDQGLVKKNTAQRATGCHVDGFQGDRVQPKVPTDLSYVVSDVLPTVFYKQTWGVADLDPARDNFFLAFDDQCRVAHQWRPAPFEIVECSAYTVHCADYAPHDLVRTFLRLTASVREFDRLGNSINPLLGPLWTPVSRDTPASLRWPRL